MRVGYVGKGPNLTLWGENDPTLVKTRNLPPILLVAFKRFKYPMLRLNQGLRAYIMISQVKWKKNSKNPVFSKKNLSSQFENFPKFYKKIAGLNHF
jgi:hypothetical protein